MIKETTTLAGQPPASKYYIWGLDLSQSRQGAGGIGGLLAVIDNGTTHNFCYDANGNVGQLVNAATGTISAHYEYQPFGELIHSYGDYAGENGYRFSTKYWDEETGLYYYGYRYYSPQLGRWINRDPIEERGGANLYQFALNNPINAADMLGLDTVVIWSFTQGVAESVGKFYIDGKVNASAEYDTDTCCVEVKVGMHLEGGLGFAKGRKWKRGLLGVQMAYSYKFKGTLVEFQTDRKLTLVKLCPENLTASFDEVILDSFFGGHLFGEVGAEVTAKPLGKNILSFKFDGSAEAKGGIDLGVGITVNAKWAGPSLSSDFSINGNMWLNANVDSHVNARISSKLIIFGKWAPINFKETKTFYDPEHVGWKRKPIITF